MSISKNIRIGIFPLIVKFGNSVGIRWKTLAKYLGHETLIPQVRLLERYEPNNVCKIDKPMHIIMLAYLGCFTTNNLIQILLGKSVVETLLKYNKVPDQHLVSAQIFLKKLYMKYAKFYVKRGHIGKGTKQLLNWFSA